MRECEFSRLKREVEDEYKNTGKVGVGIHLLETIEKEECCGKIFVLDWAFCFAKKINCKNVTFQMDEDYTTISYIWFIKDMDYEGNNEI